MNEKHANQISITVALCNLHSETKNSRKNKVTGRRRRRRRRKRVMLLLMGMTMIRSLEITDVAPCIQMPTLVQH